MKKTKRSPGSNARRLDPSHLEQVRGGGDRIGDVIYIPPDPDPPPTRPK